MRCANCGFPLSPSRTNCPKCGAATGTGDKPSVQGKTPTPTGPVQQIHFANDNVQTPQAAWGNQNFPPAWNGSFAQQQQPFSNNAYGQTLTPVYSDQGQAAGQYQQLGQFSAPVMNTPSPQQAYIAQTELPLNPQPPRPKQRSTGFTIAGLFMITGGLILLFVFFMAQSLPGSAAPQAGVHDATKANIAAKPSVAPTQAAVTPSPTTAPDTMATPTYPGQKYIDSAQMASSVNTYTALPAQPGTKFAVNQRIYVTFSVHSGGTNGYACLIWYINKAPIINYTMPVGSTTHAYSYASIGNRGPAYVEIYWASTGACTDKVLAQHVDFTVGQ